MGSSGWVFPGEGLGVPQGGSPCLGMLQACHVEGGSAGLIPSQLLEEKRKAFVKRDLEVTPTSGTRPPESSRPGTWSPILSVAVGSQVAVPRKCINLPYSGIPSPSATGER